MKYYSIRVSETKKSIPLPFEADERFVYSCKIKNTQIIFTKEEPFKKV